MALGQLLQTRGRQSIPARQVPNVGGETEWADMRAGYDALEPDLAAWLSEKVAVHSYEYSHDSCQA